MMFDLGIVTLSEIDDDGFIGVQVDVFGEGESGMPPFELYHPYGFVSRPLDPDVDPSDQSTLGCSVFYGWDGNDVHAFLGNDPRLVEKLPELKKGGSMQYGATGSFNLIDGEDGTGTQYIPYEFDDNGVPQKAHVVTVGLDGNGEPYLGLVHGDGMAVTMLDKSLVLKNAKGNAYIEINDEGIIINGNVKLRGALLTGTGEAAFPF